MKYFIPEELALGDSLICMFGNEDATKKVICKAMEYIETNKLNMPSYTLFFNVLLVSDEGKDNTIDIQRHAVSAAGYTDWGGIMGKGEYDGPSRELFIMAMGAIEVFGWDKWITSLKTKEERSRLEKEAFDVVANAITKAKNLVGNKDG